MQYKIPLLCLLSTLYFPIKHYFSNFIELGHLKQENNHIILHEKSKNIFFTEYDLLNI